MITVSEINEVLNKYNTTLRNIAELLEDDNDELIAIDDVAVWVETYNNQDCFLPIDIIDRIVAVNL